MTVSMSKKEFETGTIVYRFSHLNQLACEIIVHWSNAIPASIIVHNERLNPQEIRSAVNRALGAPSWQKKGFSDDVFELF